jgi:hypothetical protein
VFYRVFHRWDCLFTDQKGVFLLMGLTFPHAFPLSVGGFLATTFRTVPAQDCCNLSSSLLRSSHSLNLKCSGPIGNLEWMGTFLSQTVLSIILVKRSTDCKTFQLSK